MKKITEWIKEKWNSLDKNAKLFTGGIALIIIMGLLCK